MAQLWGSRPSSLLGIQDPALAWALDDALAQRLWHEQAAQQARARGGSAGQIAAGSVYEDASEELAAERRERVH
jgi:hypothetical protein